MKSRTATFFTSESDLVEIAMPPAPAAGDYIENEHHQFISDHWQGLAAAAYEGFKQFGIGVVIVEEPAAPSEAVDNPLTAHQVRYATGEGPWMHQTFAETTLQWIEWQLQTYSPSESGLFIFLRADTRPRIYRAGSSLTPPEALRQVRAKLN